MRKKILLICRQCSMRNYSYFKRRDDDKYIVMKKYCPSCQKHTEHYESR